MKTTSPLSIIIASIATITLLKMSSVHAMPPNGQKPEPPAARTLPAVQRPELEMVFVIDTTGSMGGLIEGAKQRVWRIVNNVMSSPSHPEVKVGLVAYRDHGDAYVTQVLPLTRDLDKVYTTLMTYRADGGGDEPEDVRQALADGVMKTGWSQRSRRTAQIMFLVGDAPPHDDYGNERSCQETTRAAIQRGIVVNTIQCGSTDTTQVVWQDLARRGEGKFFAIAQDGGVVAVATPYDRKLAELGTKMGGTYMAYGAGGSAGRAFYSAGAARTESVVAAAAPAEAAADRAVNKAINSYAYSNDLVQDVENGRVSLETMKKDDLPDDLQKLAPEGRKKQVAQQIQQRKALRAQIVSLSKQRDSYIAAAQKRRAGGAPKTAFDTAVGEAIRAEAAKQGIKL